MRANEQPTGLPISNANSCDSSSNSCDSSSNSSSRNNHNRLGRVSRARPDRRHEDRPTKVPGNQQALRGDPRSISKKDTTMDLPLANVDRQGRTRKWNRRKSGGALTSGSHPAPRQMLRPTRRTPTCHRQDRRHPIPVIRVTLRLKIQRTAPSHVGTSAVRIWPRRTHCTARDVLSNRSVATIAAAATATHDAPRHCLHRPIREIRVP